MSTSADIRASSSPVRVFLSPIAVLFYVYVLYFLVGLSDIYEFVYWELMNFGLRMIGFRPTLHTVLLYCFAALVLALGCMLGVRLAERAARMRGRAGSSADVWLSGLARSLSSLPLFERWGLGFVLCLAGWAVAFSANAAQILFSGRVSLFDIATRWHQSPVLVFMAALNIMFVPGLIVFARTRWQWALAGFLLVVTAASLGLLGARHLPAKLLVSTFLAVALVARPRTVVRAGAGILILLVVAMGVVGSISKAGIYGPTATWKLAVALTYADSAGTTYNLDRIVRMTPSTGVYKGVLLKDSALALVPGWRYDYANYQIGRYLGGREFFEIGGERIDRSVSLAPTLLGAPYADWGVPGVVGQMIVLGLIFGYMQTRSRCVRWVIPPFVIMASYVINGVNAGVHNPNAIAFLGLAVGVCALDALLLKGAPSLYTSCEPGDPS